MEFLDCYDYRGIKTGKTILRGTPVPPDEYTAAVVVCIFNSKNELLIQKRTESKQVWPGLWDVSCGGAVIAGETPQESAMREVSEELGIPIDLTNTRATLITSYRTGFTHTFVVHADPDLSTLTLQESEVSDARFASEKEILEMIGQQTFIPYRISWIEYLFDCASEEFIF